MKKKKIFIAIILIIVGLAVLSLVGLQIYYSDKVTYYCEIEHDEATILYAEGWENMSELYIPKTITEDGKEYPITKIADYAFDNRSTITSVVKLVIPSTVRSIGTCAFLEGDFETVEFEEKSQLKEIHDEAFKYCSSLKNIMLPRGIKYIGRDVFLGANALNTTEYAGGEYLGSIVNEHLLLLNRGIANVKGIHAETEFFENPTALARDTKNITEKSGILYVVNEKEEEVGIVGILEEYKELYQNKLINFEFPDTVRYIFDEAFEGMSNLKSIELPDYLISIGDFAFSQCTSLESIKFNDYLQSIGAYAFAGCVKLEKIYFPQSLKSLMSHAFRSCTSLKEVTFPLNFSYISDELFSGCTALETVNTFDEILYLGTYAFSNCKSLKQLRLKLSVVNVNNQPFENCNDLTLYINCKKYIEPEKVQDWTKSIKEVVYEEDELKVKQYTLNGKKQYQ